MSRASAVVLAALLGTATTPVTAAEAGDAAATQLLHRLIGPRAAAFDFTAAPAGGTDAAPDWYDVAARGGRVRVTGTSTVARVRGAYAYLNAIGAASVSWEGDRVALPPRLPDRAGERVATPYAHRLYLNTCTYGYTTPWWGWSRWEREIDWMALHGIDMPLALEGQEIVWQALWREAGLSPEEIAASLAGPAFLPWQRMGNIAGYRAPLPQGWIDRKHALQKRILARMRALGMEPVVPAFAGYVPKSFADRHQGARIYRMRAWEGFAETYWVDPADPLFASLSARFLALYDRFYGAGRYRLADAFNEMVPPIAHDGSDRAGAGYGDGIAATAVAIAPAVRDARLAEYGARLYRAVTQGDRDSIWVMQGWMFGADKQFWTPHAIGSFLAKIPNDRMLILDIGNDRYPGIWRSSDAFGGKAWVYGYVHNYGGSNPVYGDLDFYRRDLAALPRDPGRGRLRGFGMFPEGLHSNAVVYDAAYDAAWGGARPPDAWMAGHLKARYGATTPALLAAWSEVAHAAYRTRYWTPRWWQDTAGAYLLFKRPTARITDFAGPPGDPARLHRAIGALLALPPAITRAPLFRSDLVDLVRHDATTAVDRLLQRAVAAYRSGDVAAGDAATARVRAVTVRIDRLAGHQQGSLASWIADARAYADRPADAHVYAENAKALVTVWGGGGHLGDYASRAWQGLYADYYLPRWTMFLTAMRRAAVARRPFDEAAVRAEIAAWERAWVTDDRPYRQQRPQDPVGDAATLIAMLPVPGS